MHIEVFEGYSLTNSADPAWYWHFKARNGRIVADAEAFASRSNAIRAAKNTVKAVFAPVSGSMKVTFDQHESEGCLVIKWSAY